MLKITYTCFEPCLNRTFQNVKVVSTMADFRLFAYANYSGNWSIVDVEYLN